MTSFTVPPPDTSPPSIGEPDAGVINLSAYRASKEVVPVKRVLRVVALGANRIQTEVVYGDQTEVLYVLTVKNMQHLRRMQSAAIVAARDWNAGHCRACGKKACRRWHEGLIIERYSRGHPRFSCLGFTKGGRVRLRALATGKLTYSTATWPDTWGRVVGWVDIVPVSTTA